MAQKTARLRRRFNWDAAFMCLCVLQPVITSGIHDSIDVSVKFKRFKAIQIKCEIYICELSVTQYILYGQSVVRALNKLSASMNVIFELLTRI